MMNDQIFDALNENQKKAVEVLSGPMLILAGAGSGKTKTLTHRIANLMAHGNFGPKILAVTFTNKAAKEMKGRIEKLLGAGVPLPTVGTFHSVCVRILREFIEFSDFGYSRNFVIFDSSDSKTLMRNILKDFGIDEKTIKPRAILSHISSAKSLLMTPHEFSEQNSDLGFNRFSEALNRAFPEYQKRLREHNALDFDDLLQKTVELLEQFPEVLKKLRQRWNHLMIDEYQDTNFAQYKIVRLLSDEHQNLCVIGDDHQSIYKFRGADYRNILNFEKDFPAAVVIKLEQNYRSSGNILNNANALIAFNETGQEKNLWTESSEGEKIQIQEVTNERTEGDFIAEKILSEVAEGASFGDIAILYRMNAQSRGLEEAFLRNRIPYKIIGGTRFFERKEVKDMVAYLRLIFNPKDNTAFLRIINTPTRGIGASSIEKIKTFATENQYSLLEATQNAQHLDIQDSKKQKLVAFAEMIQNFAQISSEVPIVGLIEKVIERSKFLDFLNDGTPEGASKIENTKELLSVATRYESSENSLADFLEAVALSSDQDSVQDNAQNVQMMTVHASKGLEFPIVFLPGWEEGIFPSSQSQMGDSDELEEERRLGYVAITRAEKKCIISHARTRTLYGKTNYSAPSVFLEELDQACCTRNSLGHSNFPDEDFSYQKRSFAPKNQYGKSTNTTEKFPRKKDAPLFVPTSPKKNISRKEALFGANASESGYAPGDKVLHEEWGEGTVVMTSGDLVTVVFPQPTGMKKVVASITPMKKV